MKRTEIGWPGHFAGARYCLYRRNTLLEHGDVKVVVSTVGNYIYKNELEQGGLNRYYETMAFHGYKNGQYIDADVSRKISFDSPWAIGLKDSDNEADQMHETVVEELMGRMERGETL